MKKIVSRALLTAVAGLVISGSAFAADKVKLNLFYYKQEISKELKEMTDEFSKKNPDITIDLEIAPNDSMTVLKTKMVGGDAPDIIQLQSYSNVFEFAKSGWLEDLSKEPVMKKVAPGTLNAVTMNGKQYALPMDIAGIGIIYNKEIFKKYGIAAPKTFSELKKACETLKKNNVTPFAGLFKSNWSLGHFLSMTHTELAAAGKTDINKWVADMNAGKSSFGKPVKKDELFKLLDFLKANADAKAAEFDWNEQQAAFAKGEAAMMVQGLWSYGAAIGTNPKLDCGFIAFPVNDNAKDSKMFADVDSTFALSASSSPSKKKAAKKFLEWLSTPEAVKMWVEKCKLVPTFKGADTKSMKQPFQDLAKYIADGNTVPWAFSMYPVAAWEDATKNGAQEYIFGKKNADQVISYIDETWKANVVK